MFLVFEKAPRIKSQNTHEVITNSLPLPQPGTQNTSGYFIGLVSSLEGRFMLSFQ